MCIAGGRLIVPASMLPADLVKACAEHAPTGLAQVPYGWEQLVGFLERTDRTLAGLRYVTNAGDGPSLALLERMHRVLPGAQIIVMYGQTECLRTTYLPAEQFDRKRGAMGYPIPGVEVSVVDPDGRACGVDEPGELHHAGALVAHGYWNDPAATARKFKVVGDRRVLATGDVVRRDADGCLWYVGRSELMIKSSGFRFSPREIENALAAHPDVREAAAFGVADPALGQAVEVAVVLHGAGGEAALLAHLRPRLPRYMLPRRFHLVDALPRNARGKLDLDALRALSATADPD
jgi:acyl-coenzyme A synthetase/AMP-(fatty) acid ligase